MGNSRAQITSDAFVTIERFGAAADGTTDDGPVIQEALDFLDDQGGGQLYIPGGTYLVATEVVVPANITIQGAGKRVTQLKAAPSFTGFILRSSEVGDVFGSLDHVVLSDMTLDGDAMNSTLAEGANGNPLLHSMNVSGLKCYRMHFINGRSYGVGFQGYPTQANPTARGPSEDIYFQGCEFHSNGFRKTGDSTTLAEDLDDTETVVTLTDAGGIASSDVALLFPSGEKARVTSKSGNEVTVIRGAYATAAAAQTTGGTVYELALYNDGIDIKSSKRAVFIDCKSWGNANDGFDIRADYLLMTGCWAWANNNVGIAVGSAEPLVGTIEGYAEVTGCGAWDNGLSGLQVGTDVDRVSRAVFNGCFATGNGDFGLDCDNNQGGTQYVSVNGGDYSKNLLGMIFNGCTEATGTGVQLHDNTQNGITVANMPEGAGVIGCCATGNDRGMRFTGTTDKCRIVGNKFIGNTTANLSPSGTQNHIDHNEIGVVAVQTLNTNTAFTLTPRSSPPQTIHTGTLTANRTVTLATAAVQLGDRFVITRTGGGAFSLNVGVGPLTALGQNEWCEVVFDGTAWALAATGTIS